MAHHPGRLQRLAGFDKLLSERNFDNPRLEYASKVAYVTLRVAFAVAWPGGARTENMNPPDFDIEKTGDLRVRQLHRGLGNEQK